MTMRTTMRTMRTATTAERMSPMSPMMYVIPYSYSQKSDVLMMIQNDGTKPKQEAAECKQS